MVSFYTPTLSALPKARRDLQPLRLSGAKSMLVSEPLYNILPLISSYTTIDHSFGLFVARKVYERLLEDDLLDSEGVPYYLNIAVREVRRQQYLQFQSMGPFIHVDA